MTVSMYLWISYHLLAIYHSPGIALVLCSFWGQSVLAGLIYWNQAPSCCPSWHVFPVWYLQLQTHICGLTGCLGASPSSSGYKHNYTCFLNKWRKKSSAGTGLFRSSAIVLSNLSSVFASTLSCAAISWKELSGSNHLVDIYKGFNFGD